MRLLIDTNVILDFLLKREPFKEEAKAIFDLAVMDDTFEYVSASAITDIFYIINGKVKDPYVAQQKISNLMEFITVLNVGKEDIEYAINLHWKDFEDAVQYSVARRNRVDAIITRNTNDFESSEIPIYTPSEFLDSLSDHNSLFPETGERS